MISRKEGNEKCQPEHIITREPNRVGKGTVPVLRRRSPEFCVIDNSDLSLLDTDLIHTNTKKTKLGCFRESFIKLASLV